MATITRKATIAGLTSMGWTLCPWHSATTRYQVYGKIGRGVKMLVGKSGALRKMADDSPVASSLSMTGSECHRAICEVGNGNFRFTSTDQAEDVYRSILGSMRVTPRV